MALSRSKVRRVPDLYTAGTELVLKDDTIIWLQVLNPFEQDEAKLDAQAARARLVLALKSTNGSRERDIIRSWFLDDGHDTSVERLIDVQVGPKIVDIVNDIRSDPEWKERLLISDRSEELLARAPEDTERLLLEQINVDFVQEVTTRTESEREWLLHKFSGLDDDALFDEYVEAYIERRGMDLSLAEYALTELWYAARVCEGTLVGEGVYDHSGCESHRLQAWETKEEVRSLPEELQQLLTETLVRLNMTVREAKNSDRQGSSSESFPLPSVLADSTPSTQTVTSVSALGT